jgi:SSS family solute:Na+ symporter
VAGGKLPWWLVGISHHMSGYSAAVFVGYAAYAYDVGFAVYVWWAITIVVACSIGAVFLAPRWPRLRQRLGIVSPLEYLATRFNVPTQQVLAWSGAALKVFDVSAKWAASAVLLQVFAGVPLTWGILIVGGVTLIYSTMGRRPHRPRPVHHPAGRRHRPGDRRHGPPGRRLHALHHVEGPAG